MATYTVAFWELKLDGAKGDSLTTLSGDFDTESEALEALSEEFRNQYEGNFISEIQVWVV